MTLENLANDCPSHLGHQNQLAHRFQRAVSLHMAHHLNRLDQILRHVFYACHATFTIPWAMKSPLVIGEYSLEANERPIRSDERGLDKYYKRFP